jgi:hypothetical protein
MARKYKRKAKAAAQVITRSIVRVTVTADIIVNDEYDFEAVTKFASNGGFDDAVIGVAEQTVANISSKTALKTETIKLPIPDAA